MRGCLVGRRRGTIRALRKQSGPLIIRNRSLILKAPMGKRSHSMERQFAGSSPASPTDRDVVQRPSMLDSDSSDPGSTPGIPTNGRLAQQVEHRSDTPKVIGSSPVTSTIRIALSSNRLGRHPFTVKTYGFEPRRRDKLGHSAAASTPDFDSGGPGSSPGAPTRRGTLADMVYAAD